jgi:hypothetical protein
MNQNTNIACCCVSVTEERNKPIPIIASTKIDAKAYRTDKLPARGIKNIYRVQSNPTVKTNKASIQKGKSFPMIN